MPKKRRSGASSVRKGSEKIESKIVENLVALQKVHIDLAEKFDKLSKEISSLLGLFEAAARSFATHPAIQASEKDKEFLDKIDRLLEQNKTIAKGLTLMEEKVRERMFGSQGQRQMPMQAQMPPQMNQAIQQKYPEETMQPSMASRPLPRF